MSLRNALTTLSLARASPRLPISALPRISGCRRTKVDKNDPSYKYHKSNKYDKSKKRDKSQWSVKDGKLQSSTNPDDETRPSPIQRGKSRSPPSQDNKSRPPRSHGDSLSSPSVQNGQSRSPPARDDKPRPSWSQRGKARLALVQDASLRPPRTQHGSPRAPRPPIDPPPPRAVDPDAPSSSTAPYDKYRMGPDFKGVGKMKIKRLLRALLVDNGGRWTLAADGSSLRATYRFPDYRSAIHFMKNLYNRIASARHYPYMVNDGKVVEFVWQTRKTLPKGSPPLYGISRWDVRLATEADEIAADWGVLPGFTDNEGNVSKEFKMPKWQRLREENLPIYMVRVDAEEVEGEELVKGEEQVEGEEQEEGDELEDREKQAAKREEN